MATYNKAEALRRTLTSLYAQNPGNGYEVIVVNDGSDDDTASVGQEFPIRYAYLHRPGSHNPGPARNVGYRMALGEILVAQSDEVEHRTPGSLDLLAARLKPSTCVMATVVNVDANGNKINVYCGRSRKRPYLFLGALWKSDLYSVGANDEDFIHPDGGEDVWLAKCLEHRGVSFLYTDEVVGWHYDHPRPHHSPTHLQAARNLARAKAEDARLGRHPWTARTGAWV